MFFTQETSNLKMQSNLNILLINSRKTIINHYELDVLHNCS